MTLEDMHRVIACRMTMDMAVRAGNFEAACAEAKLIATIMEMDGKTSLLELVRSVERVMGK